MNIVARRLLPALAAMLAAATPALAQPGNYPPVPEGAEEAPPPAPAAGSMVVISPIQTPNPPQPEVIAVVAPQNENWSNVSHINGQIVKVGERGDYLIKTKTTSISTNPIGWMFGFYGASVTHALNQNFAIRGDANIINLDNDHGYELGISIPIYFKRVFSGPFLEAGLITRDFDTDDEYGDDSLTGPEVLFGWHWTFDSGFNVAMAFGAARDMSSSDEYCDEYGCYDSGMEVQPAGYFRVGYAF